METKTHWKKTTNPNYLGSYSIQPGQTLKLIIDKVVKEPVMGTDGKKEDCTLVYWIEKEKPMILNVTNMKAIAKVAGSPYIEDWPGTLVEIFTAQVQAFGDVVEALRIKNQAPKLDDLNPNHPKWAGAQKAVQAGNATLEQIKAKYILNKKNEDLLCGNLK